MIDVLRRAYAAFRGFDERGSTVPMMDGPLLANALLDAAPVVLDLPGADCVLATSSGVVCAGGSDLLSLRPHPGDQRTFVVAARRRQRAAISCLAPDGGAGIAIGLDGHGILLEGGRHHGQAIDAVLSRPLACPTAALFLDPDTLLVANGPAGTTAADWKRDLMTHGSSGSVVRIDLTGASAPLVLADRLAFPAGLVRGGDGSVLVSEAWRHRLIALGTERAGPVREMLGELPAYPGRLAAAADGGFCLALFAPRNQLVEFVLREPAYRRRMVETIDPAYWIAPSLLGGSSFLEPIQGGARKKLNIMKPWAPAWSYGLVVRCDSAAQPVESFHSRADGHVHGVTSAAEYDGRLLVTAKGSGVIVALARHGPTIGRPA